MEKLIDFIQSFRALIAGVFSIIFSSLHYFGVLTGFRNSISDIISFSSITLGILGVFIGLLISQKDNEFLKKAKRYEEKFDTFRYLMNLIRKNFVINILFILLTIFVDFVPSSMNNYIKFTSICIWAFLLFMSFWGVFYIVNITVNIILFEDPKDDDNEN